MRKRIEAHQAELGMYIVRLEGNWLSHPFWRARFLLEDETRLAKLRASEVDGVIIDIVRGRDIADSDSSGSSPIVRPANPPRPTHPRTAAQRLATRCGSRPAPVVVRPEAIVTTGNLRSLAPQSLAREFGHAVQVSNRAMKVVSSAFLKVRLGNGFKFGMVEPVIEDIFASVQRNPHAFNGLMRCKRDNEPIYRHTLATSALMISLGRQLKLPPEQIREAGLAGLMLDVGVAQLPVEHATLGHDHSRIEPDIFTGHVELGHRLCLTAGVPDAVANAVREHHERCDGSGYPFALPRNDISLLGRMAAICDTYDEMSNAADGGQSMDPAEAIDHMRDREGVFDAQILAAFTEAMGIYPIGSVLLLRSGRLAMVVDQNPADLSLPCVRTFWSTVTCRKVTPETIDLANCYGADAVEGTAAPAEYGIADFEAMREKLFAAACAN